MNKKNLIATFKDIGRRIDVIAINFEYEYIEYRDNNGDIRVGNFKVIDIELRVNINKIEAPNLFDIQGLDQPSMEALKIFMEHNNLDFKSFYYGNVFKYLIRFNKENNIDDLIKAKVYLDLMIKELEDE